MTNQSPTDLPLPSKTSTSRSYRACIWCRQHKRKCDGLEPCTTCALSTEGRKCEYAPPKKRGRKIKRLYDDKLSIEHVIKKRAESPGVDTYTEPVEFTPLRLPETLSLENLSTLQVHSPADSPPLRYPDSLTAPDRYNFSSKYVTHSVPDILRRGLPITRESNTADQYKLPQIRSPEDSSSMISWPPSFNHPSLQSSSSSASISDLGGPSYKYDWKQRSDSDFFESKEPDYDSQSSSNQSLISPSHSQYNILSHNFPLISPTQSQPTLLPLPNQPPSSSHSHSPILPIHSNPVSNLSIISPSRPRFPVIHQLSHSYHLPLNKEDELMDFTEKDDDDYNYEEHQNYEIPVKEEKVKQENVPKEKHKSEKKGDI